MMTQVKTTWSFVNHGNCEVRDYISFNCKYDVSTEITSPCRFRIFKLCPTHGT